MSKKRALISVSDKTGIVEFAKKIVDLGFEIISTGGTAKTLTEAGLHVINISDVTGFPECLDGRVKTLHPRIHGGLLAMRDNKKHMETLAELKIDTIDLVAVNLYPFRKTIEKEGVELAEAIENIDIGGPSMLRAAAKNYTFVSVLIDPGDYEGVLEELKEKGTVSEKTNFRLAAKVFAHTAHYDTLIANYLNDKAELPKYPEVITMTYEKKQDLRYGENPHQTGAYYKEIGRVEKTISGGKQLHGKELSYNNIGDASAAVEIVKEFDRPTAVAIKHANPCGVAVGETIYEAYCKAYEADPVSIFGGIIALNRTVDAKTAEEIGKIFVEIVIAPSYESEALEILKKKQNIRIMELPAISEKEDGAMEMKKVGGGILLQDADNMDAPLSDYKYMTKEKPTEKQMEDLQFAWKLVKHVKSNAIVIVKDGKTLGVGGGQVNRIWPTQQAIERAGVESAGAVLASDAFFPFDDVAKLCAKHKIAAIIQPGGSKNDQDSIDVCNEAGISMIFTGMRHFKH